MFRRRTTFVIGAGASAEFGLPVGSDLRTSISDLVEIKFENGYSQSSGDFEICEALRLAVRGEEGRQGKINDHLHTAWQMVDALPLALSIDNYLEAHQADQRAVLVGKLAIVKSILDAERKSSLYFDRTPHQRLKLAELPPNWLTRFFQMASEGVRAEEATSMFENVAFIVFNYDRCIELFLFEALQTYYGMDSPTAKEVLQRLRIFHPYGTVGRLPLIAGSGVDFGAQKQGARLLELSMSVKTFSERIEDGAELQDARGWLRESEQIIFLGCAYHRQNLQLIDVQTPSSIRGILGTCVGISSSDVSVIRKYLPDYLKYHQDQIAVLEPVKSFELLERYWRTISS